jgi:hypothetical protein
MDCPSAIPVKLRVPPTLLERVPVGANADSAYTDVVERNIIFDRTVAVHVVSDGLTCHQCPGANERRGGLIDRLRFDDPTGSTSRAGLSFVSRTAAPQMRLNCYPASSSRR